MWKVKIKSITDTNGAMIKIDSLLQNLNSIES